VKRFLPFVIVVVVTIAALLGTGALYRAKRRSLLNSVETASGSEKSEAKEVHALGPANAPVTLEEFGDYECHLCSQLSEPINELVRDYSGNLRVIFRNFPHAYHARAFDAALAAEAAGMQGRFWEMHDLLYREQSTWSDTPDPRPLFGAYAAQIGLDVGRFKSDVSSDAVRERVTKDQRAVASMKLTLTPTIFINNRAVPPADLRPWALRAAIDVAMETANTPSPGTNR
jgi:protein-disulfide isomerase